MDTIYQYTYGSEKSHVSGWKSQNGKTFEKMLELRQYKDDSI